MSSSAQDTELKEHITYEVTLHDFSEDQQGLEFRFVCHEKSDGRKRKYAEKLQNQTAEQMEVL